MRNLRRFLVASGALLFLGVNVGVALAFNGPPPGSPPTGSGSIVTDASNRVGLGTAAPDQLLTVKGGMVHVANGAVLTTTPGSAAGYGLFIGTDNTTGESRMQTYWDAGTTFLTFHTNSGGLASAERARIDAGGLTTTGFKLTTGPVSGYVLTSDATGAGTWAASAGDITGVTAGTGLFGGGTIGAVTVSLATPVSAANGGTGLSTPGVSGNVLTSNGAGGWTSAVPAGDITGVTAGTGLTGGGASGAVTLSLAAPVAATSGGTGLTAYITGDLLYSSAANTLAKRAIGTAGQVLTVSGGVPTWATLSVGTVTSVSGSGGVTGLTLTGGPITTSGTLTIGGTLAVANGGTGANNAAGARTNLGAAASGANSDITSLSGLTTDLSVAQGGTGLSSPGVSGNVLTSNGVAWVSQAETGDISGVTAGTGLTGGGISGAVTLNLEVPVAATNGGTAQSTYVTGDLLYASAANTLAKRAIGAAGQVLTVSGGVPTWATPSAGTVTSVSGSGGVTGLTLTGGPITTSGTLTIGGTLAVANGGTGLSTPGTAGNVLTSDGTAWISQTPAGTPSSYTVVKFITSGSTGVVTVSCPAGKKVLGGGCYGYYSSCRLRDSFPQSVILGDVAEGWYCRFMQYNSTGNCGGPNQAAYVACM